MKEVRKTIVSNLQVGDTVYRSVTQFCLKFAQQRKCHFTKICLICNKKILYNSLNIILKHHTQKS